MRTIWWHDGQVKMIDQRVLPLHFQVAACRDYREVAHAITDMVIRGAPAIGAAGGYAMALAAHQSQARDCQTLLVDLAEAKQIIDAARPTAVNLAWATQRLMALAQHLALSEGWLDLDAIRSALLAEAERLYLAALRGPGAPWLDFLDRLHGVATCDEQHSAPAAIA